MNSGPRVKSRLLSLALLFLLACGHHLFAGKFHPMKHGLGDDVQPPDLWDLATGDKIPGDELLKTMDYGARSIQDEWWGPTAATAGHLMHGDIILAVDGMRVYDWREWGLGRFRNAPSPDMTLLINRGGHLKSATLHGVIPNRYIGIVLDFNYGTDRFLNDLNTLRIPVTDPALRASLHFMPGHAAAALDLWMQANKSPAPADVAWLQDFVNLYSAVQGRRYADAKSPAHQPPIPYFQRLEKFYLYLASANLPRETPPDLEKSGETPEFYTLALPVPDHRAALGHLSFADSNFTKLLTQEYNDDWQPDADLTNVANDYASNQADGLDRYLDEVRAALIDPGDHDALPYQSDMVTSSSSRPLIAQQLSDRLKDRSDPDWLLDAYAMVYVDLMSGKPDNAAGLIDDMGKISPYLARRVAMNAFLSEKAYPKGKTQKHMDAIRKVLMDKNGGFLGDDIPELYKWARDTVLPLDLKTEELSDTPPAAPFYLLTDAPYAEMLALKGLKDLPPAPPGSAAHSGDGVQQASKNGN